MQIIVKYIDASCLKGFAPAKTLNSKKVSVDSISTENLLKEVKYLCAKIVSDGEKDHLKLQLGLTLFKLKCAAKDRTVAWSVIREKLPKTKWLINDKRRSILMSIGKTASRHPEKLSVLFCRLSFWTWEGISQFPIWVQDIVLNESFEIIKTEKRKKYGRRSQLMRRANEVKEEKGKICR